MFDGETLVFRACLDVGYGTASSRTFVANFDNG